MLYHLYLTPVLHLRSNLMRQWQPQAMCALRHFWCTSLTAPGPHHPLNSGFRMHICTVTRMIYWESLYWPNTIPWMNISGFRMDRAIPFYWRCGMTIPQWSQWMEANTWSWNAHQRRRTAQYLGPRTSWNFTLVVARRTLRNSSHSPDLATLHLSFGSEHVGKTRENHGKSANLGKLITISHNYLSWNCHKLR